MSKPQRLYIKTFGCQMNEYDSNKMVDLLSQHNYSLTDTPDEADLVLINTCSVRDKAEQKVYSLLGRLKKELQPTALVGVTGCVAQQRMKEIFKRNLGVNIVIGPDQIFNLPKFIEQAQQGQKVGCVDWLPQEQNNFIPNLNPVSNDVSAGLSIMKGCNNYCTFCVVPYTRGKEISRSLNNVIAEAQQLAENGTKEILLLGQNVNSYQDGQHDFVDLLEHLNEVKGLNRIRYTSPHPKDFCQRLVHAHQNLSKLCEAVHLPVQSGSNKILHAMRRRHKVEEYLSKIDLIRSHVPQVSISTDIIVGFPGETQADFEGTMQLIEQVRFDTIYSFKFSPRIKTPAAGYKNQVSEDEKSERLTILQNRYHEILDENRLALIGQQQRVLIESPAPNLENARYGRTRGGHRVTVLNCNAPTGTEIQVTIKSARRFSLVAA